jgi:hypothetical protein
MAPLFKPYCEMKACQWKPWVGRDEPERTMTRNGKNMLGVKVGTEGQTGEG